MKTKINILIKLILTIMVCSIASYLMITVFELKPLRNFTGAIPGGTATIFIISCLPPCILTLLSGKFVFKDKKGTRTTAGFILTCGAVMSIIGIIILGFTYSNGGVGMLVCFLNSPAYLLAGALSIVLEDIPSAGFIALTGVNPLIVALLIVAGIRLRRRSSIIKQADNIMPRVKTPGFFISKK